MNQVNMSLPQKGYSFTEVENTAQRIEDMFSYGPIMALGGAIPGPTVHAYNSAYINSCAQLGWIEGKQLTHNAEDLRTNLTDVFVMLRQAPIRLKVKRYSKRVINSLSPASLIRESRNHESTLKLEAAYLTTALMEICLSRELCEDFLYEASESLSPDNAKKLILAQSRIIGAKDAISNWSSATSKRIEVYSELAFDESVEARLRVINKNKAARAKGGKNSHWKAHEPIIRKHIAIYEHAKDTANKLTQDATRKNIANEAGTATPPSTTFTDWLKKFRNNQPLFS